MCPPFSYRYKNECRQNQRQNMSNERYNQKMKKKTKTPTRKNFILRSYLIGVAIKVTLMQIGKPPYMFVFI